LISIDALSRLTETDNLIALFDKVLHWSLLVSAMNQLIDVHTDTAGVETARVGEANLCDRTVRESVEVAVWDRNWEN
jgi:hypothetical protein